MKKMRKCRQILALIVAFAVILQSSGFSVLADELASPAQTAEQAGTDGQPEAAELSEEEARQSESIAQSEEEARKQSESAAQSEEEAKNQSESAAQMESAAQTGTDADENAGSGTEESDDSGINAPDSTPETEEQNENPEGSEQTEKPSDGTSESGSDSEGTTSEDETQELSENESETEIVSENETESESESETESETEGAAFILANFRLMSALDSEVSLLNVLTGESGKQISVKITYTCEGEETKSGEWKPGTPLEMEKEKVGDYLFMVQLENMQFKDPGTEGGVTVDTLYSYKLPSELIPEGMESSSVGGSGEPLGGGASGDNLESWPDLESAGNVKAKGCLQKRGDDWYLLIQFVDIPDGEVDISAAYQYNAKLHLPAELTDNKLDVSFEGGSTFQAKVPEKTTGPLIEKKAVWLTMDETTPSAAAKNREAAANSDSTAGSSATTVSDPGTLTNARKIKYTVTIRNPHPGEPFSASLTEKLDGEQYLFYNYILTDTFSLWNDIRKDGKTLNGDRVSDSSLTFNYTGSDGKVSIAGGGNELGSYNLFGTKTLNIQFNEFKFDTLEFSYIAHIVNVSGSSTKDYSSQTVVDSWGSAEDQKPGNVTVQAQKIFIAPTPVNSSSDNAVINGEAATFSRAIKTNGENWVKLEEKLDSNSGGRFYMRYAPFVGNCSAWEDLSIERPTSLEEIKQTDPVSYLEMMKLTENGESFEKIYKWSSKSYGSYGVSAASGWLLISHDMYQTATDMSLPNYVKTNTGQNNLLQDRDGRPAGFNVYLFGLKGDNFTFSYTKHQRRMLEDPQASNHMDNSMLTATNSCGSNSMPPVTASVSSVSPMVTKTGAIQADGTVKWTITVDMAQFNQFHKETVSADGSSNPGLTPNADWDYLLWDRIPGGHTYNNDAEAQLQMESTLIPPLSVQFNEGDKVSSASNSAANQGYPLVPHSAMNSGPGSLRYCNLPQKEQLSALTGGSFSNISKIIVTYTTTTEGNYTSFGNAYTNFQVYNGNLRAKPIVNSVSRNVNLAIPRLEKQMTAAVDENDAMKDIITTTVTAKPTDGSSTLEGDISFHDDMNDSAATGAVPQDGGDAVPFEESVAKYIQLKEMKINVKVAGSGFTSVTDQTISIDKGGTKEIVISGPNPVTVTLSYGNDMSDGFDFTIKNLAGASQVDVTYTCEFDAAAYAVAAGAKGIVNTEFHNKATLNYDKLAPGQLPGPATGKASAFSFFAGPSLELKWKAPEEIGRMVNHYEATAGVGPTAQSEIYLLNEIKNIYELAKDKIGTGEDGVPKELSFLDYFSVENIVIQATPRSGKSETIYEKGSAQNGWKVDIVENPTSVFQNVNMGEHSDEHPTGNLFAFKVSRTDGTQVPAEMMFTFTFDLRLSPEVTLADGTEKNLRREAGYDGGVLMPELRAVICYPFTISGEELGKKSSEEISGQSMPAAISYLSGSTMTPYASGSDLDENPWPHAEASLGKVEYMDAFIGVKEWNAEKEAWVLRSHTQTYGKDETTEWDVLDRLHTHVTVEDKELDTATREALLRLYFKYLTANITDIYIGEETDENKLDLTSQTQNKNWPDVGIGGLWTRTTGETLEEHEAKHPGAGFQYIEDGELYPDGDGSLGILGFKLEKLPLDTDVTVYYSVDVDWGALLKEAVESGLLTTDEAKKLSYPGITNVVPGIPAAEMTGTGSQSPAELLGSLTKKNIKFDEETHTADWEVTLDLKGAGIQDYTLTDTLAEPETEQEEGAPEHSNDWYAWNHTDIVKKSFAIYDAAKEGEDPLYICEAGESGKLPDEDGYWKNAELTFDGHGSYTLSFGELRPCKLAVCYQTQMDEDGFIAEGGNLSEAYELTNQAAVELTGVKMDAEAKANYQKPDNSIKKTVKKADGTDTGLIWEITGKALGQNPKEITLRDQMQAVQTSGENVAAQKRLLACLRYTNMMVVLTIPAAEGADDTEIVIYDSGESVDRLAEYGGAFDDGFALNKNGVNGFELKFIGEKIPKGTEVKATYTTEMDTTAYFTSGAESDSFSLQNQVVWSQPGWGELEEMEQKTIPVSEPVEKSGTISKEATAENNAIVTWTVDLHLNSVIPQGTLEELENSNGTVTITDVLPAGLKYAGSLSIRKLTLNTSGVWNTGSTIQSSQYTAACTPETYEEGKQQTLTIKLEKPWTNRDVRLTFATEAVVNIGAVRNEISVQVGENKFENASEPVEKVFARKEGGFVKSRTLPDIQLTATKYVDGKPAPADLNNEFTFQAVEMEQTASGTYVQKVGGYNSSVETIGENGLVTFEKKRYCAPATYYFQISEGTPNHTETDPTTSEYEGTVYTKDPTIYIVSVEVEKTAAGYTVSAPEIVSVTPAAPGTGAGEVAFHDAVKDLREITVTKKWEDSNNARQKRPENVTVELLRKKNGTWEAYKKTGDSGFTNQVVLNEANNWTYTWEGLPFNGDYSVREVVPAGATYSGYYYATLKDVTGKDAAENVTKFELTNHYTEDYTKLRLIKNLTGTETGRTFKAGESFVFQMTPEIDTGAPVLEHDTITITPTAETVTAESTAFDTNAFVLNTELMQPGQTYCYIVSEVPPTDGTGKPAESKNGIYYDRTKYRLTLEVKQVETTQGSRKVISLTKLEKCTVDAQGVLGDWSDVTASIGDGLVFTNRYEAAPATYAPQMKKEITGETPPTAKTFAFTLAALSNPDNGAVLPENKTVTITCPDAAKPNADTVKFGAITFNKAGTYTFTIAEQKGSENGYTYDTSAWTLTVVVEDDLNGKLVVKSHTYTQNPAPSSSAGQNAGTKAAGSSNGEATFTNTYSVTAAMYAPQVKKTITGEPTPADKTFTFELTAKTNPGSGATLPNPATVTTQGAETVEFGEITFAKAGTYTFEILEQQGSDAGYSYDGSVWTLTVVVTDDDSKLKVTSHVYTKKAASTAAGAAEQIQSSTEAAEFVNTYSVEEVSYQPKVNKKVTGETRPVEKTFRFTLEADEKNPAGAVMPADTETSVTGSAVGASAAFDKITFKKAGIYSFTIRETDEELPGYTYDPSVWTLTVTIEDTGNLLRVKEKVYTKPAAGEDPGASNGTQAEFENTYSVKETAYAPQAVKEITGETRPAEKEFSFTLAASAGNPVGAVLPQNTTASVKGAGTAAFDAITFNKAGTYTFTVSETDGGEAGYTYDADLWTLTVVVADKDSKLTVESHTYTRMKNGEQETADNGATFINDYQVTEARYAPEVEKQVTGDTPFDDMFTFVLTAKEGNPQGAELPKDNLVLLTGSDTKKFDEITFTKAGTYAFEIREKKGTRAGYTYDEEVWTATVKVEDQESQLEVTEIAYTNESMEEGAQATDKALFVNRYETKSASYVINVKKTVKGAETPKDQTFTFVLSEKAGDPAGATLPAEKEILIKGSKEAAFDEITFTKAGTYTFLVAEKQDTIPGYSFDGDTAQITVRVEDKNSVLTVTEVNCQKAGKLAEQPEFVNDYETTDTEYAPKVKKTVEGENTPADKTFRFEMSAKADNPEGAQFTVESPEASVNGSGEAVFDKIVFTKAGTYAFEIKEVQGSEPGYSYDGSVWTLTVTVEDVDSVLTVVDHTYTKTQADGKTQTAEIAEFVNTYDVTEVSYQPQVEKTVEGDTPPSDETFAFAIDLKEGNTAGVTLPENTKTIVIGSGSAAFDAITFKKAGTYVFEICEIAGSRAGYTYDGSKWKLTVVVEDHDSLLAVADASYEAGNRTADDAAEFVNTYRVTGTSYAPQVEKTITGAKPSMAKEFAFELAADEKNPRGAQLPEKTQTVVKGSGEGSFDEITFTSAGIYTFTIREQQGGEPGYTYDQSEWTLTVTVEDVDSILTVTKAVYEKKGASDTEQATFENTYQVTDAFFAPEVYKTVQGMETPVDKAFDFVLTAISTNPQGAQLPQNVAARVVGSGSTEFDAIRFTAAGTYEFEIREQQGSEPGYSYDGSVWTLTVTVEDVDSVLTVTDYIYTKEETETRADGAEFVNTYDVTEVSCQPQVQKEITGTVPPVEELFYFELVPAKDNPEGAILPERMETSVSGSGGGAFDEITFTRAGIYTFEIRERDGGRSCYTYDTSVWKLTVTVEDCDGALAVVNTCYEKENGSEAQAAEFVNSYLTGSLSVKKRLTCGDLPLKARDYTFYVALYADEACTQLASEVLALTLKDSTSAEVVFENLEVGKEYYISECEADGTSYGIGQIADQTVYEAIVTDGHLALVTDPGEIREKELVNDFHELTHSFYYEGELTITKKLLDESGREKKSDETFYVGVFADAEHTQLSDLVVPNIVELSMAGSASVSVTVPVAITEGNGVTLYVTEVDAKGVPVTDLEKFAYEVSASSDSVRITAEQSVQTVTFTNREKEGETETETETEIETETETETETVESETESSAVESETKSSESESGTRSTSVQTGDDTNSWIYLILMLMSVGAAACALLMKRRETR